MTYTPTPVDLKDVVLPHSLNTLKEQIAEHVHDIWAQGRIDDGWTHGETRNDNDKKHPCLVPYENLPDKEKEYDRNTAIGTLQLVMHSGYSIMKAV